MPLHTHLHTFSRDLCQLLWETGVNLYIYVRMQICMNFNPSNSHQFKRTVTQLVIVVEKQKWLHFVRITISCLHTVNLVIGTASPPANIFIIFPQTLPLLIQLNLIRILLTLANFQPQFSTQEFIITTVTGISEYKRRRLMFQLHLKSIL